MQTGLGDLPFGGKVDRIDRREGSRIILDYKSGSAEKFNAGHFAENLVEMVPPNEFDFASLTAVREAIKDLQLPLYVLLVAGGEPKGAADFLAAYVALSSRRDKTEPHKERYFVRGDRADALGESYARWFTEVFPGLLSYLVDHMLKSPLFYPATGERDCESCDYNTVCAMSRA